MDKAAEWAKTRVTEIVPPSETNELIYFDRNTLIQELALAYRAGQAFGESKSNRASVSYDSPIAFSREMER